MMTLHRYVVAWQRRTWAARLLLIEAVCWLGWARLLVLTLPFRWIVVLWGLHHQPLTAPLPTAWPTFSARQAVAQIRGAIQAVNRYTPWSSNCLAQALAANRMLHRRRLPSTLYLGVAKPADRPFAAHAWLRCGAQFVTGEAGRQQFTPVTCLGSRPHGSANGLRLLRDMEKIPTGAENKAVSPPPTPPHRAP